MADERVPEVTARIPLRLGGAVAQQEQEDDDE